MYQLRFQDVQVEVVFQFVGTPAHPDDKLHTCAGCCRDPKRDSQCKIREKILIAPY